jgi:UDP-N-acetylglucosamine 2-epimerase (non-hydrolysing)
VAGIRILAVAGARPNFMKLAPLFGAFARSPEFDPILVHTGQHYDDRMSGQFFRDLGLPEPHYNLEVGSGSHARQTAEIMQRFEPVVLKENPGGVLVVGDINSTVACALVAKKLGSFLIHAEAGLRSFNRSMPEEINRIVTDAIADLLLVTEESGLRNLQREGIPEEKICFVGNLMIDSLFHHLERAKGLPLIDHLGLRGRRFGLVTLHRPSNVDDPEQLQQILQALNVISEDAPLYFPVHPRTRARINGTQASPGLHLLEPLGYLDFLCLMSHSSVVLTDSGGIQEETTALGIPCLTLRRETERPITIDEGTNRLAGTTPQTILNAWNELATNPKAGRIPKLWDGRAAERCLKAIHHALVRGLETARQQNVLAVSKAAS